MKTRVSTFTVDLIRLCPFIGWDAEIPYELHTEYMRVFRQFDDVHSKLAKYLTQQAEEVDKKIDDYLDRHGLTLVSAQTQSEKEDET